VRASIAKTETMKGKEEHFKSPQLLRYTLYMKISDPYNSDYK
jgi:hypothetical protein